MRTQYFAAIILIIIALPAFSQMQEREMIWRSVSGVNLKNQLVIEDNVTFTSDSSAVVMIQGEETIPFSIQSVAGNWSSVDQVGSLTYQLMDAGEAAGVLIIGRNEEGLYLILNFTQSNADAINHRFIIDSYEAR